MHRLDVGTSRPHGGREVRARLHARSSAQFKEREVEKIYHAVVQGHPDPLAGTIDAPIGRHPTHSWKFAVTPDGKHSVTHYETLEAFPGASLLEIHLETGRTHQIRVHMAAHRHPCVGDPLYGADPTLSARLGLTRQWLHARQLSFAHPRSRGLGDVHVGVSRRSRSRARGAAGRVAAVGCRWHSGAPAVEGYPVDNQGEKVDLTMAYVGTRKLFETAGFRKAADTQSVINGFPRVVMRLDLV